MTAAPGETEVVIAELHKRLEHIPWETEAMYQLASDALALIRALSERLARVEAEEPTQAMVIAGFECDAMDRLREAVSEKRGWPNSCRDSAELVTAIYKAMRASAIRAGK